MNKSAITTREAAFRSMKGPEAVDYVCLAPNEEVRRLLVPLQGRPSRKAAHSPFMSLRQGEEDTEAKRLVRRVAERLEEAIRGQEQLLDEYDALVKEWFGKSKKVAKYFDEEGLKLHKALQHEGSVKRCEECGTEGVQLFLSRQVEQAAPKEFYASAVKTYDRVKAREPEVEKAKEERRSLGCLLAKANELARIEKELASVRLECKRLEEKIVGYPDEANKAKERLQGLEMLKFRCEHFAELAVSLAKLEVARDRELGEIEKIERPGKKIADRSALKEVEGRIGKNREDSRKQEEEIRAARPELAGKKIHEISLLVCGELDAAQKLIANYEKYQEKDMDAQDALINRSLELEKNLAKKQKEVFAGARALGLES